VLVCAVDMPFVTEDACRDLIAAAGVAVAEGRLQPLFGVYAPPALAVLRAAPPDAPLTRTVEALGPALVEVPAGVVLSLDTPEALALAERLQQR
jgi:molybdopterin-guanine dinucleotide biosynthesis protein A